MDAQFFTAPDDVRLAYYEVGEPDARPLLLIHGLFSNALTNWIKYGHATLLAEAGFRVIMPDLRAHGGSAAPHEVRAYPSDILANDGLALIAHLALSEYDLGGFSLGARTTVRMLIACARPRRVIIAGMGLQGLLHTHARTDFFKRVLDHPGSFARGTPEWSAEAFLKTSKGDANALRLLLDSFADSTREEIAGITAPCGIICGDQDNDNGSAAELAAVLPDAHFTQIPGTHMGCVVRRELGEAIRDFLLA